MKLIGRIRLVAEAYVLQALAWAMQKQDAAAHKSLIRALALAKPEGYIRLFVENGLALAPLLNQVRHLFPDLRFPTPECVTRQFVTQSSPIPAVRSPD